MLELLQSLRRSWPLFLWVLAPVILIGIFIVLLLTIDRTSDRKLHIACDRVVEHLLTTHDPLELERSRILVQELDCGVSRRLNDWPSDRTGGLVP